MRKVLTVVLALVLVAMTVLTAMRFVRTGHRLPVVMASFSSYAVIGFVLVLITCLFALRRAPRHWWVAAGAVVAAMGLAVQAWVLVPLFVGGGDDKSDLTVMTSNLQFGRGDAAAVVRTVASEDVDILVLEEVTPKALDRLLEAGLSGLLPHRGGKAVVGADGTMAFSRFPLTASWPLRLGKGGLDLQVAAPETFRLLAVHANYPLEGAGQWLADLETIRDRTGAALDQGPTLVVGDFNATHDHEPMRAILHAGVRDAAEEAGSGWQPTWPTKRYGQDWVWPLLTIDHVLTSPHFVAVRTESHVIPRTDHLALVAEQRYSE